MKDKKDNEKQESKALSWRERMDPNIAGRRWDADVQKGMGRRAGDK